MKLSRKLALMATAMYKEAKETWGVDVPPPDELNPSKKTGEIGTWGGERCSNCGIPHDGGTTCPACGMPYPPPLEEEDTCAGESCEGYAYDPASIGGGPLVSKCKEIAKAASQYENLLSKEAKKKKPGRTYKGWLAHLRKMDCPKKTYEAFQGRWKGALEYAKENPKRFKTKEKREEYAARVAIDKLPKKYLKEPTKEHGPGKSDPLTAPKKK